MDLTPWIKLYNKYCKNKYSSGENDRKFVAFTGVSPQVAEKVFQKYKKRIFLQSRLRLFIVLHFLKLYQTEEVSSAFFGYSRPTYRKYLWQTLYYLDFCMNEIQLENRFQPCVCENSLFEDVSLVVDATECAIDRPTSRFARNLHSNGRHKENTHGRYNLKYTVAVQIVTGKLCFIGGPEPGSVTDITALRKSELEFKLFPDELILCDKGYQGHSSCLTPFKGKFIPPHEVAFNEVMSSTRQIVECVFSRLKIFGVVGRGRFRHKLNRHKPIFNVCSQILNICLDRNPVWIQKNYYI